MAEITRVGKLENEDMAQVVWDDIMFRYLGIESFASVSFPVGLSYCGYFTEIWYHFTTNLDQLLEFTILELIRELIFINSS